MGVSQTLLKLKKKTINKYRCNHIIYNLKTIQLVLFYKNISYIILYNIPSVLPFIIFILKQYLKYDDGKLIMY